MRENPLKNKFAHKFDDLFGTHPAGTGAPESLQLIPISQLQAFGFNQPDRASLHCFKPYAPQKLAALSQDIAQHGVLTPLIVRRVQGTPTSYEVLAGHNRLAAAQKAGLTQVPCLIKQVDDDEAVIIMTTTNLSQREHILPSEKAFAYKAQLEALNHQGQKQGGDIQKKGRSDEQMAAQTGESRTQIHRYIRLCMLIPTLLEQVDTGKLSFGVAQALSYLEKSTQKKLVSILNTQGINLNLKQATALRKAFAGVQPTTAQIEIFLQKQMPQKEPVVQFSIPKTAYQKYFKGDTPKQAQEKLLAILEQYSNHEF